MPSLRIAEIAIGERVRKDMGDLKSLADSIAAHGLLHPVVVNPAGMLIAGHRRIEAMRLLGWNEAPVTVVEVADLLGAERDENEERKAFTPTEAVAIGRLIEEAHRAKIAATRTVFGHKGVAVRDQRKSESKQHEGQFPKALGRTRTVAASAVGMADCTYELAKAVVAAAEAEPEKFGDLPERMDETGNVSGTHRELQRRKAAPSEKKQRHAVHGRSPYRKPNREIERALIALDGICDLIDTIPTEEVDASKAGEWSESLKAFASRLNRFARRING